MAGEKSRRRFPTIQVGQILNTLGQQRSIKCTKGCKSLKGHPANWRLERSDTPGLIFSVDDRIG
jgi:hypothetical protein